MPVNKGKYEREGRNLPLVEDFYSIQGEGFHTGKPAYFIRLGGCDIGCKWCDSPFTWNPDIHPLVPVEEIIEKAISSGADSVVVTGGEPLMWNLDLLCRGLKENKMKTFLETSGTYMLSGIWDWICVSPKQSRKPFEEVCRKADELKVIIGEEKDFRWAEDCSKDVGKSCMLYLQPEWKRFKGIMPSIVEYVKRNPSWRISLQAHKFMKIP